MCGGTLRADSQRWDAVRISATAGATHPHRIRVNRVNALDIKKASHLDTTSSIPDKLSIPAHMSIPNQLLVKWWLDNFADQLLVTWHPGILVDHVGW